MRRAVQPHRFAIGAKATRTANGATVLVVEQLAAGRYRVAQLPPHRGEVDVAEAELAEYTSPWSERAVIRF